MTRRALFGSLASAALAPAISTPAVKPGICGRLPFPALKSIPSDGKPLQPDAKNVLVRPFCSELSATDVRKLILAYRNMASRKPDDPTGLVYQSLLHEYCCMLSADAELVPGYMGDVHSNSLFLPWHRAFIYFHERILQTELGPDFRLPVWDWEKNPNGNIVPALYRNLFPIKPVCSLPLRNHRIQQMDRCVMESWLITTDPSKFIGAKTSQITPRAALGPHMYVHNFLRGLMRRMETAAADPIFYAHHANVDRYWQHWSNGYSTYKPEWADDSLVFFDENRSPVKVRLMDLLDIERLGYKYRAPGIKIGLADYDSYTIAFRVGLTDPRDDAAAWISIFRSVLSVIPAPILALAKATAGIFGAVTSVGLMQLAALVKIALNLIAPILRDRIAFPVQVRASITPDPNFPPTQDYYQLAIANKARNPRPLIGGFAVPPMPHGASIGVIATACFNADSLAQIAGMIAAGDVLGLFYAEFDSIGETLKVEAPTSIQSIDRVDEFIVHIPKNLPELLQ